VTPDELKDKLVSALHPILTEAEQSGMLVGGTLTLLQSYPNTKNFTHAHRVEWKRLARITIARKGTECVAVEETRVNGNGKVRHPEPMPAMTVDQAKAIAVLDPTLKVTGEICPNCGSGNVMRRGSCPTCNDCGTSVGGCS
jgi:hypothetical protein